MLGENIHQSTRRKALSIALKAGLARTKILMPNIIDDFPMNTPGIITHFTVMSAELSTHVGCAAIIYTIDAEEFILACNYATSNMVGTKIY